MNRLAITLLTFTFFTPSLFGADTLASQLRKSKHVGVSIDDGLAAYAIYIYTPSQYKEHVASLEAFRLERDAFAERMKGYSREREEARKRRASSDELNEITRKRNRDAANPPFSPFEKGIKLNKVVSAGDDYIAIAPLDEPSRNVLIPFNRIARVILASDAKTDAADPKTK